MWIKRDTRSAKCRWCGTWIVWATRANGRVVAFDPPLAFAPSLLDDADGGDVDLTRTRRHVDTCAAFSPPLAVGRSRHV